MKPPLKRFGRALTAAFSAVAIWSLGLLWIGTPQQAFAQAVGCVGALTGAVSASGVVSDPACYDAYKLSYFDVASAFFPTTGGYGGPGHSGGAGDALLRIVDAGNWENSNGGDVCANIYVYNDTQEQLECCSCPLTANALLTFSVINNLTKNPLNTTLKEPLTAGVIKIVGSNIAGGCSDNPVATTAAGPYTIAGGLHEWINHTESLYSLLGPISTSSSVEEFTNATLDSGELASLQAGCKLINATNHGGTETVGICSCAPETPGPTPTPPTPTPTPAPTPGVIGSSTEDTISSGQTNLEQFLPDGTADGQFMFAEAMIQGSGVGSDVIVVPPGWTSLALTSCGPDFLQSISYRIAAGSDAPGTPYGWNFCTDDTCATPVTAVGTGSITIFSSVATGTCAGSPSSGCAIQSGTGAPACECTIHSTIVTAPSITPLTANSLGIVESGAVGNVSLGDQASPPWTSIFEHANPSTGPDNRESWGLLPASAIGASTSTYGSGAASDNIGCVVSTNPL